MPGALLLRVALFWGVDQLPLSPFTPSDLSAFQPISPEDFTKAKGHVYPLLLVRLALTWVCDGHVPYRAASLIFSTLTGFVVVKGPCAETVRLWLLRVGLFLLRRPILPRSDWVYLLDLTIQLGQHKCLVILGISLTRFRQNGCRLAHRDVQVLTVQVLTSCTGEIIRQQLTELSKLTGTPCQIVSDHGSDVLLGVRLFCQNHEKVIETYDVTHGLAILLKHRLERSARWDAFVKNCQCVRQQVQQTAGSFLQPPAWRQKARYLNLESHLRWARDMLSLLDGNGETVLSQQMGFDTPKCRTWLEEKLGWLHGYREDVRQWSYYQWLVKNAEEEIKQRGLRSNSWRKIGQDAEQQNPSTQEEKEFLEAVRRFVKEEGEKLPDKETHVGSTDVLESMFGKYKDLAQHGPCREITANVLMIPLFATTLTASLLRQALEAVHEHDLDLWIDQQLDPSPQKKKNAVLTAARLAHKGPILA